MKSSITALATLLVGSLFFAAGAQASWAFETDRSFARQGVFRSYSGSDPRVVFERYADGRLLIGSSSSICRLLPGGRLDLDFAQKGCHDPYFITGEDGSQITDIDLLADGRILYSATTLFYTDIGSYNISNAVGMLKPDGRRARGFGQGGVAKRFTDVDFSATAVARRSDGQILVSGGDGEGGVARLLLLDRDGKLSKRFGRGGGFRLNSKLQTGLTEFADVTPLSRGRSLVSGYVGKRLVVAKLNRAGTLVRSFGRGGVFNRRLGEVPPGDTLAFGYAAAEMMRTGDRTLLLASLDRWESRSNFTARIYALNSDGELDRSFGDQGVFRFDHRGSRRHFLAQSMTVDREGRIFVAGNTQRKGSWKQRPAIRAISADGELSRTFARRGTLYPRIRGMRELNGIATGGPGALFIGGKAKSGVGEFSHWGRFAVARLKFDRR